MTAAGKNSFLTILEIEKMQLAAEVAYLVGFETIEYAYDLAVHTSCSWINSSMCTATGQITTRRRYRHEFGEGDSVHVYRKEMVCDHCYRLRCGEKLDSGDQCPECRKWRKTVISLIHGVRDDRFFEPCPTSWCPLSERKLSRSDSRRLARMLYPSAGGAV